ncbi:MAG: alkaline phosphatase family protein [Promicromonosporaceae bacterium]|nr:alkaline phosphatase family protein [Promicromonosporaceae bacterium]
MLMPDGLIAPTYGVESLAAVLPAAAGVLGVDLVTATGLNSTQCAQAFGLPPAERVVVVLCDGLGYLNLAERVGHAPTLRRLLPQTRQLTTCFPSTTAAALGALGTGTAPHRTGLVGYTARNPATGSLANLVSWTEQADPRQATNPKAQQGAPTLAISGEELQREPTIFERLVTADRQVTSIGLTKFAGSGMTLAALRGGNFMGVDDVGARVDAVARAMRRPGLAYLYWGELDKVGHKYGWQSANWGRELETFDRELSRLLRCVPPGTLLLVTADHGQMQVDLADRLDVATSPALREGVSLIAGEPRAVHVYANREPGCTAEVARRWRETLEGRAVVGTRDEALAAGWFGPPTVDPAPHVLDWLGDVVVAPLGRLTIVDSRTQTKPSLEIPGAHGSLTPLEMTVPLTAELVSGG